MKTRIIAALAAFAFLFLAYGANAQDAAPAEKVPSQAAERPATVQDLNTQEYITLLRQNVRSQKAKLMGDVMQLDADDAVKFWPIYKEYDAELTKVNDRRVAIIHEYSETYTAMTDTKADELTRNALEYQKLRGELLAKYYEKMKDSLGAITAARFLQVEHQLLLIIDLQIASELPIVGS
jgi:hypothetical protein